MNPRFHYSIRAGLWGEGGIKPATAGRRKEYWKIKSWKGGGCVSGMVVAER